MDFHMLLQFSLTYMSGMVLGVIFMSYLSEYAEKKALREIMKKEKEEKEKINLNHRV